MDEQGWDMDTWEEVIKKAIDAEAKAACQPQFVMKEMGNYCPWGHRPTKTDKPTREPKDTNKNSSKPQKSKTQALQRSENADTSKDKAWKDRKKRKRRDKQDRQHLEQAQEGSTPAIGVNATNTLGGHSSGSKGGRP